MAQKVVTTLIDDLDGTESKDIETVTFGLHGATYEIDLKRSNVKALEKALTPYLNAARKAGKPATRTVKVRSNAKALRAWAKANGYDVPDRGRIPKDVEEAFRKAGN